MQRNASLVFRTERPPKDDVLRLRASDRNQSVSAGNSLDRSTHQDFQHLGFDHHLVNLLRAVSESFQSYS